MDHEFILNWRVGARTAACIVNVAGRFASTVELSSKGFRTNAKSIMGIMLLGDLAARSRVRLFVQGPDAPAAMMKLRELFTIGFPQERCPYNGCPSTPILIFYTEETIFYGCSKWHEWEIARKGLAWPSPKELRGLPSDHSAIDSQPPAVPKEGSFPWPGRERLSPRDRILLESRSFEELIQATGAIPGDLDAVLGFFEYLLMDWQWLHSPKHQAERPGAFSYHSSQLRTWPDYAKMIQWEGKIPANDSALESWNSLVN